MVHLGRVSFDKFRELIELSTIAVSITTCDGTPNTMLDTMAYGGIPVMSNIDSIKEWIVDGENGYIVNSNNPVDIAAKILQAFDEKNKHNQMCKINDLRPLFAILLLYPIWYPNY